MLSFFRSNYIYKEKTDFGEIVVFYDYYSKLYTVYLNRRFVFSSNLDHIVDSWVKKRTNPGRGLS